MLESLHFKPAMTHYVPSVRDQTFALTERYGRSWLNATEAVQTAERPLFVTFLPTRFWVGSNWRDNLKRVPMDRLTNNAPKRTEAVVRGIEGICYVDLLGSMRELASREGSAGCLYIPYDYTHLSALGHDLVAMQIAQSVWVLGEGEHGADLAAERMSEGDSENALYLSGSTKETN